MYIPICRFTPDDKTTETTCFNKVRVSRAPTAHSAVGELLDWLETNEPKMSPPITSTVFMELHKALETYIKQNQLPWVIGYVSWCTIELFTWAGRAGFLAEQVCKHTSLEIVDDVFFPNQALVKGGFYHSETPIPQGGDITGFKIYLASGWLHTHEKRVRTNLDSSKGVIFPTTRQMSNVQALHHLAEAMTYRMSTLDQDPTHLTTLWYLKPFASLKVTAETMIVKDVDGVKRTLHPIGGYGYEPLLHTWAHLLEHGIRCVHVDGWSMFVTRTTFYGLQNTHIDLRRFGHHFLLPDGNISPNPFYDVLDYYASKKKTLDWLKEHPDQLPSKDLVASWEWIAMANGTHPYKKSPSFLSRKEQRWLKHIERESLE